MERIAATPTWRIVAFAPITAGFAFAALEGTQHLLDWGVREAKSDEVLEEKLNFLLSYYQPDLLALEREHDSRLGARARYRIEVATNTAADHQVATAKVSRDQVKETLGASTKAQIASVVGHNFTELHPRLPRERKLWTSEDKRMGVFTAVSIALTVLESL